MYNEPIFLKPVFKERIWGGSSLQREFGYDIPNELTGECWGISAHANGPNEIINGPLAGQTLSTAWNNHRELFANHQSTDFPLLVKILDANNDLSVQVHPNDHKAQQLEGETYGKTECWYIISAEEDAEIIYGHHASSKEQFEEMVQQGQWDDLLTSVKVKAGDFFYVPSGTIHAIGKGMMILETQQSSDRTYRVYDYDRTDAQGNTRELHIDKAIEVSTIPHVDANFGRVVRSKLGFRGETLVSEDNFTVYKWEIDGEVEETNRDNFLLVSVIDGDGTVVTVDHHQSRIKKGDHFIIPSTINAFQLEGKMTCIVSHPS